MKAILFASAALLASAAQAKPLAIVKQFGGFCHISCPSTTITVDEKGSVNVEVQTFTPAKIERYTLAKLNAEKVIAAIQRDIEKVAPAKLVDTDPEGPICMDIPQVRYSVIKNDEEIVIGEDRECKEFRLETYEATGTASVLKSLMGMHNFAQ